MKKLLLLLLVLLAATPLFAQVNGGSPPYTFSQGVVISSTEVNSCFSKLFTDALDRTGGTMTGTLTSQHIVPAADNAYDLGSDSYRFRNLYVNGTISGVSGGTFTDLVQVTSTTTPQFKARYDSANHVTLSVASNGATTFNATGGGAAFAFSDSVAVTGDLSATGVVKAADGTAGAPSVAFTSATTTGMYKTTTGIGWSIGGANAMEITASGLSVGGTAIATVPTGMVAFFNLEACPTGWTDLSATYGGRYVVALPSAGTLAGTAGTALTDQENRAAGIHTHTATTTSTDSGHTHNYLSPGGSGALYTAGSTGSLGTLATATGTATISSSTTVANSSGVAGTNAPYVQLRMCSKN